MKAGKHTAQGLVNPKRLDHLLARFTQLKAAVRELIKIANADFSQIRPSLKRGGEMLGELQHIHYSRTNRGQIACLGLKETIRESYTKLGHAATRIQFFDMVQQQLEHMEATFHDQQSELDMVVTKPDRLPEALYLHALPELFRIHTAQLTWIEDYYCTELVIAKEHLKAALECLRTGIAECQTSSCETLFLDETFGKAIVDEVYQLVDEELVHCQVPDHPRSSGQGFRRVIAAMQNLLAEVAAEYRKIRLDEDKVIKTALLMKVRTRYTMKSEWELHDHIVRISNNRKAHADMHTILVSDHDIELF